MLFIKHKQSSLIQTNQTGGQPYCQLTIAIRRSKYSVNPAFNFNTVNIAAIGKSKASVTRFGEILQIRLIFKFSRNFEFYVYYLSKFSTTLAIFAIVQIFIVFIGQRVNKQFNHLVVLCKAHGLE